METIAIVGIFAGAVFIGYIGVENLVRPDWMARSFGFREIPQRGDPFRRLKGVRDVVSGLMLLAVLIFGDPTVIGVAALVAAVTPLGDMIVVLANNGRRGMAFGIHGVTALAVALLGAVWLAVGVTG